MDVVTERSQARPPYRAYATIMGVYAGGLALSGAAARLLGRDPRDLTWLDLATLSAATFKRPARSSAMTSRASSASLSSRATLATNDFLQAGFAALTSRANELET
jgi:hypothetical protein